MSEHSSAVSKVYFNIRSTFFQTKVLSLYHVTIIFNFKNIIAHESIQMYLVVCKICSHVCPPSLFIQLLISATCCVWLLIKEKQKKVLKERNVQNIIYISILISIVCLIYIPLIMDKSHKTGKLFLNIIYVYTQDYPSWSYVAM